MLLLKFDLQEEGQLYAIFLLYVLILERKCFAFQCLNLFIHMYFPIVTGVENGLYNRGRIIKILLKNVDCKY